MEEVMRIKKRDFTLGIAEYALLLAENSDLELEIYDGKGEVLFKAINPLKVVNNGEFVNTTGGENVNKDVNNMSKEEKFAMLKETLGVNVDSEPELDKRVEARVRFNELKRKGTRNDYLDEGDEAELSGLVIKWDFK